jgi:hypothetical protein
LNFLTAKDSVKPQTMIQTGKAYRGKVGLGDSTGSRVEAELHLTNLSVHVFHEPEKLIREILAVQLQSDELDDEIYNLVLQHRLSVGVGDKE